MQPLKWLGRLSRSERGNALAIFAISMPLLIGSAAIGVDTIQVSVARRQLQRAADSAAIAGTYALVQNKQVNAAVTYDLGLNNDVALAGTRIENAPTAGPQVGNKLAVRVQLSAVRPVPFISFFTKASMPVSVEATAAIVNTGEYCAISLEDGTETGISMGGNATVDLGCGMITNSRSGQATYAFGSATIRASPIAAVGGVPPTNHYDSETIFLPYSPEQADPFASLPTPVVPSGCSAALRVQPNESFTVEPAADGIYCYKGMDIKGSVNLAPGVYYIDGSSLSFGAQAVVNGQNVTFILTSRNALGNPGDIADLDINGGATLDLTSPDGGPYSGVLFYQDRRAEFGDTKINGNSGTHLRGALYFPSRKLIMNGTAGMSTECVQLVAMRLEFKGNAAISNECPANGGAHAFSARMVRLVG